MDKNVIYEAKQSYHQFTRNISWSYNGSLQDVKNYFWAYVKHCTNNEHPVVLAEQYTKICQWLYTNNGLSLLLYGGTGQGKTMIMQKIIPVMLYILHNKIIHKYTADYLQDNRQGLNIALSKPIITVDDVGIEARSDYKDLAFTKVLNAVDNWKMVSIVSTNLNGESLRTYYGDRAWSRILGNFDCVMFDGNTDFRTIRKL